MRLAGIHHIAIIAGDYELSKRFYMDVLGFECIKETWREERQSMKGDFTLNGVYCLELFSFPDSKERSSFPEQKGLRHLAFGVHNLDEWHTHLTSKGVEVQHIRLDDITQKRFCFFYDPDRQPLELYEL